MHVLTTRQSVHVYVACASSVEEQQQAGPCLLELWLAVDCWHSEW
jgi:hypothetical protein